MAGMDNKRYTFDVDLRATKTQVKNAVEEIFGVKVVKVNIMNVKGTKSAKVVTKDTLSVVVRLLLLYLPTQMKLSCLTTTTKTNH